MSNNLPLIEVAQIGRLVGLRGELKLHVHSDFPEQFKIGRVFTTQKNLSLKVHSYNQSRGLISFVGFQDRQSAAQLVNSFLFTTVAQGEEDCVLEEGEFYWYDVIGASVVEDGNLLGIVEEIERIASVDYVVIKTDALHVSNGLSKQFYVPYIERYVKDFSKEQKTLYTNDAMGLLENS
jgi:16S rRNA processing protein RimM